MARDPANSTVTAKRPLPVLKRPDLIARQHERAGRHVWVLKDPVALEYHQLGEEEYQLLQMLDGRIDAATLQRWFEQKFAPRQLSYAQLQSLLALLHRRGLVISDAIGQGEQLRLRLAARRRQRIVSTLGSVLAIRFRGVDPEPLLAVIYPWVRLAFSIPMFGVWLLLVGAALLLVAVQFDELLARLPDLDAFLAPHNLLWIAITLASIKIVHELAHGLTCKHFGGECHEIGVMLLVFTPCLYCNVSDSWLIPSKWRRMAIAAAGIYVELAIAAVCTFLWWFSEPGRFNTLCLNAMFVASVSTVLFNGNPLLRYDGYYLLSDLLDVPNLWQQSRSLLTGVLRKWCLGVELVSDRTTYDRRRWLVLVYGVGSVIYRTLVVVAILFFLFRLLRPYGLQILAELCLISAMAGGVLAPLVGMVRLVRDPAVRRNVRRSRLAMSGLVVLAATALLFGVPFPFRVAAPVIMEPRDARRVYVSVPGTLVESVRVGVRVRAGDRLARLEDLNLERELVKLESDVVREQLKYDNLEALRSIAAEFGNQIPTVEQSLQDMRQQVEQRRRDLQRLVLTAPIDGTVLAPPETPDPPRDGLMLPTWFGSPMDPRNLGCYLARGSLFCLLGEEDQYDAVLFVRQDDIGYVQPGQATRIALAQTDAAILRGTVRELAKIDAHEIPPSLGKELLVRQDRQGRRQLDGAVFQVRVDLDKHDRSLLDAASGRAKIIVAPQPLGRRLLRALQQTLTFEF